MKLPAELVKAVIAATPAELADRLENKVGEFELFTIRQVAERLKVSEPKVRRLVSEYVELGEASRRISAKTLNRLIHERTIKV